MHIADTVSLSSLGYNEAWLQEKIWSNPACLGLGELDSVIKEQVVSSGGKLDMLLMNPLDDSMYEVEVMLGETDASHIMRTIEYWDLVRRKWPKRQHTAVLIAEKITKRFFNVISILSGSVPIIAIQVNAIKTPTETCLHFTTILDAYEEIDDGTSEETGSYDEAYWAKKSPETLSFAKHVFNVTSPVYQTSRLSFCKHSINIVKDGYNQIFFRTRLRGNVFVQLRVGGKKESILQLLDSKSIQVLDKHHQVAFTINIERAMNDPELFRLLAEYNDKWWSPEQT